jgi:xylan 1,4-beta-xylosidase
MRHTGCLFLALAISATSAEAQTRSATLALDFAGDAGPMEMNHISLGQGGLSPDPMWHSRVAEIRALHPRLIRLFVQEYFNILPAPGHYHFDTLDQSVNDIIQAGAIPLIAITIKPKVLYPKVDQDVTDPTDYRQWEQLISTMVDHYKQKGLTSLYWEVGNEGDIGETGGSPNRFTPENYTRHYRHTIEAVLRVDPTAHVGGPAVAGWKSPIIPALIAYCDQQKVRLDFVSWHIYDSDPKAIEATIHGVKELLAEHPSLHPETILDEWNMALTAPPKDVRIQPAFVAETVWRMKEAGLTYSCFYHIRDYHVERSQFLPFFSPGGASFMASWWNRMPQYSGLFDYQNVMRPDYFTFELLARVTGERLHAESNDDAVHAFLAHDDEYKTYNLIFWNFSSQPANLKLDTRGLKESLVAHRRMLDAEASSQDENSRLRPLPDITLAPGEQSIEIELGPYGIESWAMEPTDWAKQLLGKH